MTPPPVPADDTWLQIKALFEAALALPAERRGEYVRDFALTPQIAEEVLGLLGHTTDARGSAGNLTGAGAILAPSRDLMQGDARAGWLLGAWRLSRPLGAGGMGEVWLADRADGSYDGQAAVKLLKRGMDSASVLARFNLERQALARLEHPNIARLLDAGLTPDGLPYFVMEHVQGLPIDKATADMDFTQRLEAFLQLTDAVAYAHRNLLVHRDLKPSNVLINTQGQVKLLDFGIAKALDTADFSAEQTRAEDRVLTPSYASPEQVRGDPVSTSTDIYSLGVLLYVMLTGARPYARDAQTPQAIADAVLHMAPTKPSGLSAQQALMPNWEQARKRLAGDLDNILLKSLAKSPQERYASVDAFAADIRAHLSGHPVSARPQSLAYTTAKFVQRNRLLVGLACTAVFALVGGSIAIAWQAKRANELRAVAEQRFDDVYQFARSTLFDVDTALRDGPTAGREKLVSTAIRYLDKLAEDEQLAAARPELLRDMADAYERVGDIQGGIEGANLGKPKDAQTSYARALALRERLTQANPQDLRNVSGMLEIHKRLGDHTRAQGDLKGSLPHYTQAAELSMRLALAQPSDPTVQIKSIESQRYLSSIHFRPFFPSLGNYAEGRQMLAAVIKPTEELLAKHPQLPLAYEIMNSVYNQWFDLLRMEGQHDELLRIGRANALVVDRLMTMEPQNPKYQRFLALTYTRLGEAELAAGNDEAGFAAILKGVEQHRRNALADPANERAQRNVANAYGVVMEQYVWLERYRDALAWSQREFELLTELRAKYPQVKFLEGRLDDAARDYAVLLALNDQVSRAISVQGALQARLADEFARSPTTPEAAKGQVQRAAVWAKAADKGVAAAVQERDAAVPLALKGVEVLRSASEERPYDTVRLREYALAALRMSEVLRNKDAPQACRLVRSAHEGFAVMKQNNRLPAQLKAAAQRAQATHLACSA